MKVVKLDNDSWKVDTGIALLSRGTNAISWAKVSNKVVGILVTPILYIHYRFWGEKKMLLRQLTIDLF